VVHGSLPRALIQAAEAEIAQNGIGAVSLRAIARRAGVSHQAPGHFFRDRNGLLTALAVDGFHRLTAHMMSTRQALPPDASVADQMTAVGVAYVTFADQQPAVFSLMMRPELHNQDDEELVRARVECYSILLETVASACGDGWGRGHSVDELAMASWALVHGAVTLWQSGDLAIIYPDTAIEEVARHVTGVLASALAQPSSG